MLPPYILPHLCARTQTLYSSLTFSFSLTFSLTSARELEPFTPPNDESTLPHLPFWLFWPPQKRKKYILKISKKILKSPTILIVISHNLKPVKISYANGRVSVRIFYKNNSSSKSELRFIKLIRKKIHRVLVP